MNFRMRGATAKSQQFVGGTATWLSHQAATARLLSEAQTLLATPYSWESKHFSELSLDHQLHMTSHTKLAREMKAPMLNEVFMSGHICACYSDTGRSTNRNLAPPTKRRQTAKDTMLFPDEVGIPIKSSNAC